MRLVKSQLITLFIFLFLALALLLSLFLVSQRQEIRKKAEEGPILTVCPTAGIGCDYVGGDGIQQAVNSAFVGDTEHKTKIFIRGGQLYSARIRRIHTNQWNS